MRTYGLTMIPTSDSIVPVLLPFYTAESQNSLERGSRPYSVVEILREVFKEDFQKAIQSYMEKCPEGAAKAIGVDEARNFRLVWLSEPRVESSLHQPACTTAVDLIFKATVEAMVLMILLLKLSFEKKRTILTEASTTSGLLYANTCRIDWSENESIKTAITEFKKQLPRNNAK